MSFFRPNPKKPRIKLSDPKYHKLRLRLWKKNNYRCEICRKWTPFNEISFHHKNTGGMGMKGDDTEENGVMCCLFCHPD
jgi:hypothetical protein